MKRCHACQNLVDAGSKREEIIVARHRSPQEGSGGIEAGIGAGHAARAIDRGAAEVSDLDFEIGV